MSIIYPDFKKIYNFCKKKHAFKKGRQAVWTCISEMNYDLFSVEEVEVMSFSIIKGYKITINGEIAFFPRPISENNNNSILFLRQIFLKSNMVLPAYFSLGFFTIFADKIKNSSCEKEVEKISESFILSMFDENNMARFCLEKYKKIDVFDEHYNYIVESMESYFSGHYSGAILTLIPCIEGIIRNIGNKIVCPIKDKVDINSFLEVLNKAQYYYIRKFDFREYSWIPDDFIQLLDHSNERIQVIESVKFFMKSFYRDTRSTSSLPKLSRHGIIHGFFSDFHNPSNYLRLVILLNSLSFTSIMIEGRGSILYPNETEESKKLEKKFIKCSELKYEIQE